MSDTFTQMFEFLLETAKRDTKEQVLQDFIATRKKGAKRIEDQARAKRGASMLTATHFAAKQTPYKDSLARASKKDRDAYYKRKVDELVSKLKNWHTMSQNEFQTIMGKIEAWGEVALESKKPKKY